MMQHIFLKDWEEIIQTIVEIESLLLRYGYEKYCDTITLYIIGSRKNVPIDEIQCRLSEEGRKRFVTTAEELMREGEMKEKIEVVNNALQMDLSHEQIIQLTGLSSDETEKIAQDTENY